jgi:hypothetical protein
MSKIVIRRLEIFSLVLGILLVAACNPSEPDATNTPDTNRAAAAQTALAGPTATPRPIPSATPRTEVEQELARTVFRMTEAIRDGDVETYLSIIWQDDPIFLQEQTQWIESIAAAPLNEFDINLTNIREVNEDLAYGRMSMNWRNAGAARAAMSGGAIMTVKFHKAAGEDRRWLFGGEAWETVGLYLENDQWTVVRLGDEAPTDVPEVFRVYYFPDYGPLEGTSIETQSVIAELPTIYGYIRDTLDYAPENTIHIKVYDWRDTLRAMSDITLSQFYDRWVQPHESVKVSVDQNSASPINPGIVTAEVTKMFLYEMAENTRDRLPWWILEGTSEMIRSEHYRRVTDYNNIVEGVVAVANVDFQTDPNAIALQDWDTLENWEMISPAVINISISQSHIFITFISDVYGQEMRNQWISEIASGQSVDEATEDVFEKSLDDLTSEWQDWLNDR